MMNRRILLKSARTTLGAILLIGCSAIPALSKPQEKIVSYRTRVFNSTGAAPLTPIYTGVFGTLIIDVDLRSGIHWDWEENESGPDLRLVEFQDRVYWYEQLPSDHCFTRHKISKSQPKWKTPDPRTWGLKRPADYVVGKPVQIRKSPSAFGKFTVTFNESGLITSVSLLASRGSEGDTYVTYEYSKINQVELPELPKVPICTSAAQ